MYRVSGTVSGDKPSRVLIIVSQRIMELVDSRLDSNPILQYESEFNAVISEDEIEDNALPLHGGTDRDFTISQDGTEAIAPNVSDQAVGDSNESEPPTKKQKTNQMKVKVSIDDFEDVMLSDVVVEKKEVELKGNKGLCSIAVKIKGFDVKDITLDLLRRLCSRLKVSGYKNKSKVATLILIAKSHIKHSMDSVLFGPNETTSNNPDILKRGPGCTFRLLNIIFSEKFHKRFTELVQRRTRDELDRDISIDSQFWMDVREEFVTDGGPTYHIGKLQFDSDIFNGIDPSVIVEHPPKKLKALYADLRSKYKVAFARFTKSGTHANDSEFFDFCDGRLDLFYMHLFVRSKPGWDVAIAAQLPRTFAVDGSEVTDNSSSVSTPQSKSSKRSSHERHVESLLAAIDSSGMRTEVAKKKIEGLENNGIYQREKICIQKEHQEMEKQRIEIEKQRMKFEERKEQREEQKMAFEKQRMTFETHKQQRDNDEYNLKQFSDLGSQIMALIQKLKEETDESQKILINNMIGVFQRKQDHFRRMLDAPECGTKERYS